MNSVEHGWWGAGFGAKTDPEAIVFVEWLPIGLIFIQPPQYIRFNMLVLSPFCGIGSAWVRHPSGLSGPYRAEEIAAAWQRWVGGVPEGI